MVDVLVDACQMRLPLERIRACLAAGWMVLVTGSKFFGGPPFAGALLVPAPIITRASQLPPLALAWPIISAGRNGRIPCST